MSSDYYIFTRLDEYRDQIKDVEKQMAELRQRISQIKAEAQKAALDSMLTADNDSDALELATQFYWLHDDLITSKTVGEYFGVAAQGVVMRIGKATLDLKCVDCGRIVKYYPTSRTDAKTHIEWGTCVCVDCEEARKNGYNKRAEEYKQYVAELCALPYQQYLKTPHWQDMRTRMLKRASFRCQLCNKQGQLHVHHRTYKNRGCEEYKDLIVLCADCHQTFHDEMELAQ